MISWVHTHRRVLLGLGPFVMLLLVLSACDHQRVPDSSPAATVQTPIVLSETSMQTKGVVVKSVVDLYHEPSKAADVVSQATLGTELSIWESREGWYYARMPDQYQGWIQASHVRVYAQGEPYYPSTTRVVEVKNLFAFVYHEPDVTVHKPALQLTIGTRLELVSEQEGWIRIALPDKAERWIQKGDVVVRAVDATRPRGRSEEVIVTAKRFLGLPYLWGGTTPLGIDCSGFVQLVYRLNGVDLLRDADIQYAQFGLAPVDKEELQAGDLLFFGQGAITHVGIYIGDGEFIHATTHECPVVQISHLDDPHWTELYRGAKRP
jgi:SH3-like domain-containing protein